MPRWPFAAVSSVVDVPVKRRLDKGIKHFSDQTKLAGGCRHGFARRRFRSAALEEEHRQLLFHCLELHARKSPFVTRPATHVEAERGRREEA